MTKFKPTAGQTEVIDVIAHIVVMEGVSKNVNGMEGLLDHYLSKVLTNRQRGIYQALQERIKRVRKDLLAMEKQARENDERLGNTTKS